MAQQQSPAAARFPPPPPPKRPGAGPPPFPRSGPPALPQQPPAMAPPGPPPFPQQQAAPAQAFRQQPAAPAAGPSAYGSQLTIWYMNQSHVVTKDRFIIGRGKQSSDLTIKDPNVSRQHAMVEFLNGQFYMVDMGSTNGIEYNGQRIARKAVAEGDVFRICDHELRFTYR
jgi:pSer/pThr/pTyr-binding forkhead associated (FHA) protein